MSSTQVTARFGDDFLVEVYDDLSLEFLDHDIQFDQAAHEFGYPETLAMELLKAWNDSPATIIIKYITHLYDTVIDGLILDFFEHVIPNRSITIEQQNILAKLLKTGRSFQSLNIKDVPLELQLAMEIATQGADSAYTRWKEHEAPLESDYAAQTIRDALRVIALETYRPCKIYYAVAAAETARICMAYYRYHIIYPSDHFEHEAVSHSMINNFKNNEECWQVRRFIDIINAHQAGRDWPSVGATP